MNKAKVLDITALVGMGLGMLLILQPWWAGGFRLGFFTTLVFTIMHIFTSHMNTEVRRQRTDKKE